MRRSFGKDGESAFGRIESFPKRKGEGSRDHFPAGYVFDVAELVEAPDHVVVGQHTAVVDSSRAAGY